MKKLLSVTVLALIASSAIAGQSMTSGYIKQNGTYVAPSVRTTPDANPYNNYSTRGNTNPYTGSAGTRDPAKVQQNYAPSNGGIRVPSVGRIR